MWLLGLLRYEVGLGFTNGCLTGLTVRFIPFYSGTYSWKYVRGLMDVTPAPSPRPTIVGLTITGCDSLLLPVREGRTSLGCLSKSTKPRRP